MSDDQSVYLTLLKDHIETFEDLEVVLILDEQDVKARTASGIAESLGTWEAGVLPSLDRLTRTGLVLANPDGTYRINRSNADIARGVDELRARYASDRLEVMCQMNANAIERIRTSALRAFARAFVFRKSDG